MRLAWRGKAWRGEARPGLARLGRLGSAGHGGAGLGKARLGLARLGRQGAARRGLARRGKARHGRARRGGAGHGRAGQGGAGKVSFFGGMAMEIRWKQGSQFRTPADVAHGVVEAIRKKNGGSASAEDIVQAAKAARNPLHGDFEWDDKAAAHEHRLWRARNMMNSFVVVRGDLKTDRPQRVYEVVREPQDGKHRIKHVYRTVDDIMKDTDLRAELLGRAMNELISIRNRYRDLQELAVVLRAIDTVVEQFSA